MKQNGCDFNHFLCEELEEIKRHRWIESEKAGRDLGDHAVIDWIQKYSAAFRLQWMESRREVSFSEELKGGMQ
jgi:hypothetical protein